MKYKDWLDIWYEMTLPALKARTSVRYLSCINNQIIPRLGDCELADLTAPVLQKFVAEIAAIYAGTTVKGAISLVRRSLQSAEELGFVEKQYSDKMRFKVRRTREIECLTLPAQKKLENFVNSQRNPKLYGIVLCLYTGLRVGELLALEWSDIDFRKQVLSVKKSCHDSYSGGGYMKFIEPPKTRSSQREIPLPRQIMPTLRELRKNSRTSFVVEGKNGKVVSMRSYENTFSIVLKKLGLPHMGMHSLRHTFATRALECGMDVKTLSEILGHRNASITLNCYVHSLPEHKCAMMNKLGKYLQ